MKTAYDVLGLNREAAPIDIEHSYHRAVSAYHARSVHRPQTKEDQQYLRELREAYLLLSSPSQRHAYDLDLLERELQRGRVFHAIQTALALLLVLSGVMLLGAGFYSTLWRDLGRLTAAVRATPPLVQAELPPRRGVPLRPAPPAA